jgi:hypothetical protein
VGLDHVVLIGLPDPEPLLRHLRRSGALLGQVLGAGDLGGFAEAAVDAGRDQLVVHVADGRAGGQAGGRVRFAALGRHPKLRDRELFALQLRGCLEVVLGDAARLGDRHEVARALDAEARHRLAGLGDAFDHALRPAVLDADHHDRRDVRVGARADQGAEVEVEVLAELEAAVGVRQRQRALDVVRHRLAGGVGEIVEGQDDDVVAHADAAVLAAVALEGEVGVSVGGHGGHPWFELAVILGRSAKRGDPRTSGALARAGAEPGLSGRGSSALASLARGDGLGEGRSPSLTTASS